MPIYGVGTTVTQVGEYPQVWVSHINPNQGGHAWKFALLGEFLNEIRGGLTELFVRIFRNSKKALIFLIYNQSIIFVFCNIFWRNKARFFRKKYIGPLGPWKCKLSLMKFSVILVIQIFITAFLKSAWRDFRLLFFFINSLVPTWNNNWI